MAFGRLVAEGHQRFRAAESRFEVLAGSLGSGVGPRVRGSGFRF